MKWLIVEDYDGPIVNWLGALMERNVDGAKQLSKVQWIELLETAKRTSGSKAVKYPLRLPRGCDAILNSKGLLGVQSGDVIVLCVKTRTAGTGVRTWLSSNLPSSCLAFLDYTLADNPDARLAELIAPKLAKSCSQLCYNHSSTMPLIAVDRYLGLPRLQRPFYKLGYERLIKPDVARLCVAEAVAFWKMHNETFTGDAQIDRVICLFARGKADQWDDGNPFCHDQLRSPSSSTLAQILSQGFSNINEVSMMGLFLCEDSVVRDHRNRRHKKVSPYDLQRALAYLGLSGESVLHVKSTARWQPPFLPGILFLCHLKLMMTAYSDRKEGRRPPTLHIYPKCVQFTFNRNIEASMSNWRHDRGNSAELMQAAGKGCLGRVNAPWLKNPAARSIRQLLQPDEVSAVSVTVHGCKVTVSWDGSAT